MDAYHIHCSAPPGEHLPLQGSCWPVWALLLPFACCKSGLWWSNSPEIIWPHGVQYFLYVHVYCYVITEYIMYMVIGDYWLYYGNQLTPCCSVGEGGKLREHKTSFHAIARVVRNEGVLGLYNGWVSAHLPYCNLHVYMTSVCSPVSWCKVVLSFVKALSLFCDEFLSISTPWLYLISTGYQQVYYVRLHTVQPDWVSTSRSLTIFPGKCTGIW